eukprot:SAG31_NODE_76_length_27534_cov_13.661868_5_plen_203_part_00
MHVNRAICMHQTSGANPTSRTLSPNLSMVVPVARAGLYRQSCQFGHPTGEFIHCATSSWPVETSWRISNKDKCSKENSYQLTLVAYPPKKRNSLARKYGSQSQTRKVHPLQKLLAGSALCLQAQHFEIDALVQSQPRESAFDPAVVITAAQEPAGPRHGGTDDNATQNLEASAVCMKRKMQIVNIIWLVCTARLQVNDSSFV